MNEDLKRLAQFQEEWRRLLNQIPVRAPGVYEIEVAEVLMVGQYSFATEEAIVRDTKGELWRIPEDRTGTKKGLISRWDIVKGMKLRLTVESVVTITNIGSVQVCE